MVAHRASERVKVGESDAEGWSGYLCSACAFTLVCGRAGVRRGPAGRTARSASQRDSCIGEDSL